MKKDLAILGGIAIGAGAIAALIFSYGLKSSPSSVPITVIAQGNQAPFVARTNYVIKNSAEWDQFKTLFNTSTGASFPSVDFSKNQVLAVFAGAEPTGGYTIGVSKVADQSGERMVSITITAPGPTCAVTQATTSPYQVVVVPATALKLSHTYINKVHVCK